LALEDHIVDLLRFVADDLETAQTPLERFDKSRGDGPKDSPFSQSAAELYAALRLADGFDMIKWFQNTGRFAQASSSSGLLTIGALRTPISRT